MHILRAIADPNVFAKHFKGGTWDAWRAFLAALFALPMTADQLAVYRRHTKRERPPASPVSEAWLVCGRRAGKSFVLATVAVFLATFKDWRPYLAVGEVGTVAIVAADRAQARTILRYILGLLHSTPMLKQLIVGETRESVSLKNRIQIEVHTQSFRSVRGYTIVAALLDEIAFWPSDELGAFPDIETINALRPGMATVPNAVMLCASSPHARRGALWAAYRRHYGVEGDPILVWSSDTRSMNATVPQRVIDAALEDDRPRALAEYFAQFRSDVETYINREVVEDCVVPGLLERPYVSKLSYSAFVDPSGGSSDSMTLCIGHREGDMVIVDRLVEQKPPFSPERVAHDFAEVMRGYGVKRCVGDRYAGAWPVEQFKKCGIEYEPSARPKGELYLELLPRLNSRRIELPDHQKMINQLVSLERRVVRGGRDSVDHPPGQHDDLINVVAGVASLGVGYRPMQEWIGGDDEGDGREAFQRERLRAHVLVGGQPRVWKSPYW